MGIMVREKPEVAEHLNYDKVSNRLKASLSSELRQVANASTSDLRRQLTETARLIDELQNKYAEISQELAEIIAKISCGSGCCFSKGHRHRYVVGRSEGDHFNLRRSQKGTLLATVRHEIGSGREAQGDRYTQERFQCCPCRRGEKGVKTRIEELTDEVAKLNKRKASTGSSRQLSANN